MNETGSADSRPVLHEPTDEAFACFRLEIYKPFLDDDKTTKRAWALLRETSRLLNQSMQRALRDVVVHVGDLRVAGKTRFAVPSERMNEKLGVPPPVETYTEEDFKRMSMLVNDALKASGVSEYVYSSVARKLLTSELSGTRLKDLLRGDRAYPEMRNVSIMMRGRNWRVTTEPRVANGKTYEDVVVEISALKPHTGKVRIVCRSLHGPKAARNRNLLKALAAMGTGVEHEGWTKGALTIRPLRRPGQPEKWEILLPYSSPRANAAKSPMTVAVHRSVVNMLTAVRSDGAVYHFPGDDVVRLKHQMYARRRAIQRDLSANPHRGRGTRRHHKALVRLGAKEARMTQTHLWRAARWIQTIAENAMASHVIVDDFTTFDPDQPGPPWEPYVRRWPWSDLKSKVIDALTRRAGLTVEERPSKYISQHCPKCGHVAASNIVRLPSIRGAHVERGVFKCGKCAFSGDVDTVAGLNLGRHYGFVPPEAATKTG